ncbi:MAG: DUF2971 domain-containing protein [Lachnospiraceae bacterium]|nr:DUF2971 domain-containing protein [Lachnospiraceae bacterium]
MNNEERKIFWETLRSLNGIDCKKDREVINEVIKYPKYLYRFRAVEEKTLDALRKNRLYFSTSNYYDDPFDTFIHVDIREFKDLLSKAPQALQNSEQIGSMVEYILEKWFKVQVQEEQKNALVEYLKSMVLNSSVQIMMTDYIRNIRNEIKKDTWSVCFSEDGLNENLWLKYANQHRGFVVVYDLENGANLRCGREEKCRTCGINEFGTPLYPIYYSDEKYNATKFAQFLATCKMIGNKLNEEMLNQIMADMGNQLWERERITLIKKECHRYDKEWRMIAATYFKEGPVMREWIPDAVILGYSMSVSDEAEVIGTAYQAGIKKIYKCYINDDGDLDAILLPMFDGRK